MLTFHRETNVLALTVLTPTYLFCYILYAFYDIIDYVVNIFLGYRL